ncbi:hypothetical protein [Streptomyces sp. AS02]|uniref:hypothetical protein n=1 Tax=Streptomyces sp. AS02 TaxID=2938946 RepID=UPI0020211A1A|nr:hypothetical protein [Streptomyces sp. AS02]MCL8016320.1 hypothetical protein [Streptomyces sp. AS02]
MNTAAAVCAAQMPAAALIWWIGSYVGYDDYAAGPYGPYVVIAAVFLLGMAVLALPFVALAHAVVHIVPADHLARLAARHVRGPVWAWHLVSVVALGVFWAGLAAVLWDMPFTSTALILAALGVLPVLGLAYFRRLTRITGRARGFWGVWAPSLSACTALFLLVVVGGMLGTVTGVLGYEPPVLSARQLAGVWRGTEGAVLRLDQGGRAELTGLPTESESGDWSADPPYAVCEGAGRWSPGEQGGRDAVVVRLDDGCGQGTYWMIGGSEREPELFARFGDPDAGEVWILVRG